MRADSEQLLGEVQELIEGEARALEEAARSSITSIAGADRVVSHAHSLLEEIVPEMAWQHVEALVKRAEL